MENPNFEEEVFALLRLVKTYADDLKSEYLVLTEDQIINRLKAIAEHVNEDVRLIAVPKWMYSINTQRDDCLPDSDKRNTAKLALESLQLFAETMIDETLLDANRDKTEITFELYNAHYQPLAQIIYSIADEDFHTIYSPVYRDDLKASDTVNL